MGKKMCIRDRVLTLVLNRTECLEELLEALLKSGIHGGTVLELSLIHI